MPVSIVTSLLLWSALLLPGAKADSPQVVQISQAPCLPESATLQAVERMTIHSRPLDQPNPWTISEADTEEEDSSEGGAEGIVSEGYWPCFSLGRAGHLFSIRIDPGTVRSSTRSPILRC